MWAIGHGMIAPREVARVRGCDHAFCCHCILNWALQKKRCPLCNEGFTHLWLYKHLDGTYNDYLHEESAELLHCAVWFKKAVVTEFSAPDDEEEEYHEMLQYMYGGDHEDDEDEAFYFRVQEQLSRGRRAMGNRRLGTGGFMQAGRRAARKAPEAAPAKGLGPWTSRKGFTPTFADAGGSNSGAQAGSSSSGGGGAGSSSAAGARAHAPQ